MQINDMTLKVYGDGLYEILVSAYFLRFFFPDSVYNNVLEEITKFKTGIISGYNNNLITF